MDLRASRVVAALAVLPLSTGALALLPGAFTADAAGACAPSLTSATQHAAAAKKAKVHTTKPVATKVHKKKYVAKSTVALKQGTATVAVTQSLCPDGAAGTAATTTQSASGTGVLTKSVTGKGATRKAATKAAKAKAKKIAAKLKKQAATKKARKKAEKRAVSAATVVAKQKAHDALYLSDIAYVTWDADEVYHVSTTPPAGVPTETLRRTGGDLTVSVPAGYDTSQAPIGIACLRRAAAWPTSFLFDGGDVVSPQMQGFAANGSGSAVLASVVIVGDIGGTSTPQRGDQGWHAGWGTSNNAVTYQAGMDDTSTVSAGTLVCVLPQSTESVAYTATVHGARVGTTLSGGDGNGLAHVTGGIPAGVR